MLSLKLNAFTVMTYQYIESLVIYLLVWVGCGYCCSGMYSGPLVPQALRIRQPASNSIIFLVSFCIGDDYGKFSIKQLAIVKSARSFYHFLWVCTFHKIPMFISGVLLARNLWFYNRLFVKIYRLSVVDRHWKYPRASCILLKR